MRIDFNKKKGRKWEIKTVDSTEYNFIGSLDMGLESLERYLRNKEGY